MFRECWADAVRWLLFSVGEWATLLPVEWWLESGVKRGY